MADAKYAYSNKSLNELLTITQIGAWDWELATGTVVYSAAWGEILGYSPEELLRNATTWEGLVLPEDLAYVKERIERYLSGKASRYEAEFRMTRKDGTVIWVQDRGKIAEYDPDGKPFRFIGVLQDVSRMKNSEKRLTEALRQLENHRQELEHEIALRTREITEQDKMLRTVNEISKELLTFNSSNKFGALVHRCLHMIGETINKHRVYIWKDREGEDGEIYCTQRYEWVRGVEPIQGKVEFEEVPYRDLPSFANAMLAGKCLNSLVRLLTESEQAILGPQGIRTILIAPISVNGKRWGFIGVDDCENERLFTGVEEVMLGMSGSLLANTIEKMKNEAEMREMEERNQLMLNATPLCCNLWSADFRNICCNDEAVRLFGLSSQQEYLDRFFELSPEFQPCGERSEVMARRYIETAFREGYCRFEWLHQTIDGSPIPSEITLVRVKYKDSHIVTGYTRDLREFKAMLADIGAKEEALCAARDEALLGSQAKTNFLANMSHEIRTPMNAISGFAEIIMRESAGRQVAEYAKGIKNACNNLLGIINDILDISKIESGKMEIVHSQYELASLLNDVIAISRMRVGDKPLMFITDIDSRLPARLIGDELRIKQILLNLLSNAIKFTSEGCVTLKVSPRDPARAGDGETWIRFSVSDTGIGLREEDMEGLFVEFERVKTTKTHGIEGTGLGLPIAKRLCEMMNGSIEVESEFGKGSTFTVKIPQECPEYFRLSSVDGKKRVLVYEPREPYLRSIAATIANLGGNCVSCSSQAEIDDHLRSGSYDFILAPSSHLKKIKSLVEKSGAAGSVVGIANYGEALDDDGAYTLFMPVNCLQMTNLLNGEGHACADADAGSTSAGFTAPSARVLLVDDNAVNTHVASTLMEPYRFVVDTAANGVEAVEMIKSNKYDLVFMDHMMPEMDGIDATAAVRQLDGEYFQALPIIALTANALVGTREMFFKAGMNDFLSKPIEMEQLGKVLAKWLPQSKKQPLPQGGAEPIPPRKPKPTIPDVDIARGVSLVGGGMECYLQVLSLFHSDGKRKCASLPEHLAAGDIHAFAIEIHALKSALVTIGAAKLSAVAAKLEEAAQKGDVSFIEDGIHDFLTTLAVLLDAIASFKESHGKEIRP